MTLATDVLILDPTPPEPLFRFCRALLGADDSHAWTHDPAPHRRFGRGHPASMGNVIGQGLPSMCDLDYATDGPLTDLYWEEGDEGDPEPPCALRLSLDTAYGYARYSPNGVGCQDLHAWLVVEVGLWCEERNLRYRWENEFTGEWFDSVLDIHNLGDPDRGRLRPTPTDPPPLPEPVVPKAALR